MRLPISCPECGSIIDLFQALDDADGKLFVDELTSLPPQLIKPFLNYLRLFKPKKQAIKWSKMLRLTRDLSPMIRAAQITRNGIAYAAPADHWLQLFNHLSDRPSSLQLPLKDHGYLLQTLANQCEKLQAKKEQDTESAKRKRAPIGEKKEDMTHIADVVSPKANKKPTPKPPPQNWKDNLFKPEGSTDDN